MSIINFKDVSVEKSGVFILKNLNLDIASERMTVVLGSDESGGKTMIQLLAGLEKQGVGDVTIDGINISTNNETINRQTGFVLADSELYESFSAIDNVLFYADLYGIENNEAYDRAADLMRMLSLWKQREVHYGALTSSEKIKLRIVRALIHSPSLLIVDDVLKFLDNESLREVDKLFKYLISEEKISIVIFTDNPAYSFGADDYVIMINGAIAVSGSYENIRANSGLKSRVLLRTRENELNLPGYEISAGDDGSFEILVDDKNDVCEIVKSAVLFNNNITEARVIDRSLTDIYSAILERSAVG